MPRSLLDPGDYRDIVRRIEPLAPDSPRLWGKLSPAQALAHCTMGLDLANGTSPLERSLLGRLIGGLVKRRVLGPEPWKQGLPTDKRFIVDDPGRFEHARSSLLASMQRFHEAGRDAPSATHPFFGAFTRDEWGQLHWKHLDHHLRQFSA